MAIKKPKPEEIVVKLRQVEVLMGQGMPRIGAIKPIRTRIRVLAQPKSMRSIVDATQREQRHSSA
jgi:hypothetical protein